MTKPKTRKKTTININKKKNYQIKAQIIFMNESF